jgi:hypothetical protein
VEIKEIKIGELLDFVESEEYKALDIKPITKLRAVSQFHNPDANPEELALIYAVNNNELLSFAGLLPKYVNGENTRIFSNSCWWAHPVKGKGLAIPLFLQLLKRANNSLFLAESTTRAKTILEKTGLFGPIQQHTGFRGFIRFYLADMVAGKYPEKIWLSKPLVLTDFVLNFILWPARSFFITKFSKTELTIEPVSEVTKEIEQFIHRHSTSDFVQKTAANFAWFKKYPWVQHKGKEAPVNYPFTNEVKKFDLNYFVLKKVGTIKAFVAITNRDNLAKIPFVYFNSENIKDVVWSIMHIVLKKKYDSLVIFHPELLDYMEKNKMPFYFRKKEIKYTGTTKQIDSIFKQKPTIQDGDGDVIFI